MECRPGCAACCTVISIASPLPGMPSGKPAGTPCVHLDHDGHCRLWGEPSFPRVCRDFPAAREHCGSTREEAIERLAELERTVRADFDRRLGFDRNDGRA
ncbi:MAG: YkgJ family cysteine cluster protein [Planctomycetota bacterium]|jgi:Fe-S-cluster containining protein